MTCISSSFGSMQVGVRQQRQETRALDRRRQLALIVLLGSGDARGHDLAVFLDEILQDVDVLVVDFLDALGGETAELLTLEQVVAAFAALAVLAFAFCKLGASSHRAGHISFPRVIRIRLREKRRWCRYGSGAPESRDSAVALRVRPTKDPGRSDRVRPRPARRRRAARDRV